MKKVCFVLALAFLLTISTILPSAVSAMEESSKDAKSEASELSFEKNSIQQKNTNDQKDVAESSKIDKVLESKKIQERQKVNFAYDVKKVVVPAVWYPVDKDTNKVIPGLNPLSTYPEMYKGHPDYKDEVAVRNNTCLLYTSPSPRDS